MLKLSNSIIENKNLDVKDLFANIELSNFDEKSEMNISVEYKIPGYSANERTLI